MFQSEPAHLGVLLAFDVAAADVLRLRYFAPRPKKERTTTTAIKTCRDTVMMTN